MIVVRKVGILAVLAFSFLGAWGQQVISETDPANDQFGRIVLVGTGLQLTDFKITTQYSDLTVLGDYWSSGDSLIFNPRFVPDPGVYYRILYAGQLVETISFDFDRSRQTQVALWPEVRKIPENTLRVYLRFSQPMSFTNPYEHIELWKGDSLMKDVFVEVNDGLWNENRTRLTLLFHPGRVKLLVGPGDALGKILVQGEAYELRISDEWPDAFGENSLAQMRFLMQIDSPVRERIDPNKWQIKAPKVGSNTSLEITFDRLMDPALALKKIRLLKDGIPMPGKVEFSQNQYLFLPASPWTEGNYQLEIRSDLEDICGNDLRGPFDWKTGDRPPKVTSVFVPLTVY